jgi:hypothetical protein
LSYEIYHLLELSKLDLLELTSMGGLSLELIPRRLFP